MSEAAHNRTAQQYRPSTRKPSAAAVVWSWKDASSQHVTMPNRRRKGAIQGLVGLTAGTVLYGLVSYHMGMVVWTTVSMITLGGYSLPGRCVRCD